MTMPNNTGPMTQDNMVERVAEALSPAEREALLMTHSWDGAATMSPTLARLCELDLLAIVIKPHTASGWGASWTPLGHKVAKHLHAIPSATMHGSDSGVTELEKAADAWDAHCLAVERCNAAIPDLEATRAERQVYDERYRASEQAKRDMYEAAFELAKWASANRAAMSSASAPDSGALREALGEAREAIASLDEDALGMAACVVDFHDGREEPHPIRDELLAKIDAALNLSSDTGER